MKGEFKMKKTIAFLLTATLLFSLSAVAFASPTKSGLAFNVVKRYGDLEVNGAGNSGSSYEYSLSTGGLLGFDKKIRVEQKSNNSYRLSGIEGSIYHSLGANLYLNVGARDYKLKDNSIGQSSNKFTLQAGIEYRQKLASGGYTYAAVTMGHDLTDYELGLAYDLPFATLDVNYRSEKINDFQINGQNKDAKNEGVGLGLTFHF